MTRQKILLLSVSFENFHLLILCDDDNASNSSQQLVTVAFTIIPHLWRDEKAEKSQSARSEVGRIMEKYPYLENPNVFITQCSIR